MLTHYQAQGGSSAEGANTLFPASATNLQDNQ